MLPLVLATAAFMPAPRAPASALAVHRSLLLQRDLAAAAAPLHARRRDVYMEAYEMSHIEDETMYDDLIEQASKGLVVIKVFASWCRACKAMAPKLDKVAKGYPEIEFYDLMFDNNKKLCKKMGIKVLPYIEIVKGGEGKVEGFSCGPSKIGQLEEKLQQYSSS